MSYSLIHPKWLENTEVMSFFIFQAIFEMPKVWFSNWLMIRMF